MATSFSFFFYTLGLTVLISPVYGQLRTPCTTSMLTTFTPCINFITNSTGNGVSPSSDCCNSLRSVMNNGTDCMCLIATGGVPFQLPINRTLAISLPRACNMPGVPLQCKAAPAPVPASGPAALTPSLSPQASAPSTVPELVSPASAPEADSTPPFTTEAPTATAGSRPVLTPSAAVTAQSFSPLLLISLVATIAMK